MFSPISSNLIVTKDSRDIILGGVFDFHFLFDFSECIIGQCKFPTEFSDIFFMYFDFPIIILMYSEVEFFWCHIEVYLCNGVQFESYSNECIKFSNHNSKGFFELLIDGFIDNDDSGCIDEEVFLKFIC